MDKKISGYNGGNKDCRHDFWGTSFLAALFIITNTIKLTIYSRKGRNRNTQAGRCDQSLCEDSFY